MSEAVKEVIKYLFTEVDLDVIVCGYYTFNNQSRRVQEKCGFKHLKNYRLKTSMSTIEDSVVNILLKKDWSKDNE